MAGFRISSLKPRYIHIKVVFVCFVFFCSSIPSQNLVLAELFHGLLATWHAFRKPNKIWNLLAFVREKPLQKDIYLHRYYVSLLKTALPFFCPSKYLRCFLSVGSRRRSGWIKSCGPRSTYTYSLASASLDILAVGIYTRIPLLLFARPFYSFFSILLF